MNLDRINQLTSVYRESRALLTAIELDLFTRIHEGATAAAVSRELGSDADATGRLLNALVALGFAKKSGDVFRPTEIAGRYLSDSSPESIRQAKLHTVRLWDRWDRLTEILGPDDEALEESRGGNTESFIAAMHRGGGMRARTIVETIEGVGKIGRMLDVGGGSGIYSVTFAQAASRLEAVVFDRPDVVEIAQRHISEAGLAGRVTTQAGDMTEDSLGDEEYDLVFFSSIFHMFGPETNRRLMSKAYEALKPGGRMVLQDFILSDDKTSPLSAAMFALHMLVATDEGNAYSRAEYAEWMREAGFTDVELIMLDAETDLMQGWKRE